MPISQGSTQSFDWLYPPSILSIWLLLQDQTKDVQAISKKKDASQLAFGDIGW
jgi:hypothetical protein